MIGEPRELKPFFQVLLTGGFLLFFDLELLADQNHPFHQQSIPLACWLWLGGAVAACAKGKSA
jgi:hypothetical protein